MDAVFQCFPLEEQLPNILLVAKSSLFLQQVEMVESKLKNSSLIRSPSPAALPEPGHTVRHQTFLLQESKTGCEGLRY